MKNRLTLILQLALLALAGSACSALAQSTTTDDSNITPQEIAQRQANLRAFFQEREKNLHIVSTETLPDGSVVDFIPRDPVPPGMPLSMPVDTNPMVIDGKTAPAALHPISWLERNPALQGPPGTVPSAHFNIENYLSYVKVPAKDISHMFAPPEAYNLGGGNSYDWSGFITPVVGTTGLGGHPLGPTPGNTTYGTFAVFNVWNDIIYAAFYENPSHPDEHTLAQLYVSGAEGSTNTVEAGYMQDPDIEEATNGQVTYNAFFFVFYCTQGQNIDGPNVGGYNTISGAGWHQVSNSYYPGTYVTASQVGGSQVEAQEYIVLGGGNWCVYFGGRLIGYYPASLFSGTPGANGLTQGASEVGAYGEVYFDPSSDGADQLGMGSGLVLYPQDSGTHNYMYSAYIRNWGYVEEGSGGQPGASVVFGDSTVPSAFPGQNAVYLTDWNCYNLSGPWFAQSQNPGLINFWYYGGEGYDFGVVDPNCLKGYITP